MKRKELRRILLFVLVTSTAAAQQVLVSPPTQPSPVRETTEQTGDTNGVERAGGATATSSSGASHETDPFQWGPVVLHPGLSYGLTYGTGLQSQPGQSRNTLIQ